MKNLTPARTAAEQAVDLAVRAGARFNLMHTTAWQLAPRQGGPTAIITRRPVAISSTVPASVITELRANNTVLPTSWCTTATLVAPAGRF